MLVRSKLLFTFAVLLVLLGAAAVFFRLKRDADRTLTAARQTVIDRHSVSLKSRTIIPQGKTGYRLFPAALRATDGIWFRDHLFVTSNLGLLQFDAAGREVKRYTSVDGLPGHELTALAKTAEALWVGAGSQGLLKFTGTQFELFYAENASDFEVTALLAMPSGELWVGTKQRGLVVFQNDRAVEFVPAIGSRFVTALEGGHQQAVIGTFDEGAWIYRQGLVSHFKKDSGEQGSLLDNQVTSAACSDETVYVGTPLGATEIRNGRTVRNFAEGLAIRAIAPAPRPVAVTDQGIVTLAAPHPSSARALASGPNPGRFGQSGVAPAGINRLLPLSDGWLALTDSGLYTTDSLERNAWERFVSRSSDRSLASSGRAGLWELSDINVSAIAFDPDQNLWVGYFDRGLDVFDPGGRLLVHHEDDRLFCVNHLLVLGDGQMAVSTANGLAICDATRLRHFITEKEGLIHKAVVMTLDLGEDDGRWLAATAEGVSFFEGNRATQNLFALHGLASNRVYCASKLGNRVYIGTLGGISVLQDGRLTSSWNTANSGLAANWVNAMAVLGRRLFIGTYGGGIQSVEADGQWTDYAEAIGRFEVNPNAMAVDGERLYVGTLDRGIHVYDERQNRWQLLRDGLPSQNVTAFALAADRVLVGTSRGLVEIRKDVF